MKLSVLKGPFSILRYPPEATVPEWIETSPFFSLSRTADELSIVCLEAAIQGEPDRREDGWCCLKVEGPLDFSLTGILASIASPLADANISIFAISTFDTDYVLLKHGQLDRALAVLGNAGFDVS